MMDESYRSILGITHSQIKVEGSKFLADIFPATSVEEAEGYLQKVKEKYFDATHHCFAYAVGMGREHVRYSDDGEPSGTAGVKILSAIQSKNLSDIIVVITRYFGGTKLGVGGLGRAYFDSAQNGLLGCTIITKVLMRELNVRFSFNDTNAIMNLVNKTQIKISRTTYTPEETIAALLVKPSQMDSVITSITNTTKGRAIVDLGEMKVIVI